MSNILSEEHDRMLSELLDVEEELSLWETAFVYDLVDRGRALTEKQEIKLEEIYEEYVG